MARRKSKSIFPFRLSFSFILILILACCVVGLWLNLKNTKKELRQIKADKIEKTKNISDSPTTSKIDKNELEKIKNENEKLIKENKSLNESIIKKDDEIAELKIQLEILEKSGKK